MISINLWGWVAVGVLTLIPLIFWATAMPIKYRFINQTATLTSFGQICSLTGLVLFACTLFLSARLKLLEDYFGGLNKVYIAHHYFGIAAFTLVFIHPIFLTLASGFVLPSMANWVRSLGLVSLSLTLGLILITLYLKLPYHLWKITHKFMGLAFFIGAVHGVLIASDISRTPALKFYMLAVIFTALTGYFYRTVLGKFLVPKIGATVFGTRQLTKDTVEIELSLINKKLKFAPGQFVFIKFLDKNISQEWHPFSLTSDPNSDRLLIAVKVLGGYTQKLLALKPNTKAEIEGPFGRFFYQVGKKNQVWIAGGIGIAPFVSMAKSLSPDYSVDLYYSVKNKDEAAYLAELKKVSANNPNFKVELVVSNNSGHLRAETIAKNSPNFTAKDFYICGPDLMMKDLRTQLNKLGIRNGKIHTEEFNLD